MPPCFYNMGLINLTGKKTIQISNKIINLEKNGIIIQKKKTERFKIIIEVNFRIYIFKYFDFSNSFFKFISKKIYSLPYFYVGEINENYSRRLFQLGVTSDNILKFIKKNLHYTCNKIPSTFEDRLRIWEISFKKKYFFGGFLMRNYNSNIFFSLKKTKSISYVKTKKHLAIISKIPINYY
ncbi:hypothetical protein (nucleomorph) [Guillardia theta]|uniref:General transcription factor IIH subunit 4 n=1 Tax=Guillardia theta TaxID=55529 RepID=Q98S50_GUITH|nr:hypothetical protein GTHECHR3089 [Guillardia theta]AAK39733.1 hypothetical protein [Guillardia theta]